MKKFYKICGLIFGLLLLIGLILLVVFRLNNNPSHDYNGKHAHYNESKTFYVKKFDNIKLACYRPDIRISLKDINKFKVVVRGGHGADIKKIKTKVDHNMLTISDQPEHDYNDGYYSVDVYVPAKSAIKKITGFCEEGDFYINSLNVPRINLTIEDGNVSAENVTTHKANFDLADGDLKITNSTLTSGILNLSDGDLTVTNSQFKIKATLGDGDVRVNDSKLMADSSFNLSEGDFQMSRPPKISYQLATSSEDELIFHGNNYHRHFARKLRDAPLLKVSCGDGDILIN